MFYPFTAVGTYHLANGGENQDAICTITDKKYRAAALADGVSTCPRAKQGAVIASEAAAKLFTEKGDYFFVYSPENIARFTVEHVLYKLQTAAEEAGEAPEDYSSTLMCVAYDRAARRLLCFNLGDGLILGLTDERIRVLSQPFNSSLGGCCVTTTVNAAAAVSAAVYTEDLPDTVLLLTDGAWQQLYDGSYLKPEIRTLLSARDFAALGDYLAASGSTDDCSFIAMTASKK